MSSKNDKQYPHQNFDMNGMLDIEAEMLEELDENTFHSFEVDNISVDDKNRTALRELVRDHHFAFTRDENGWLVGIYNFGDIVTVPQSSKNVKEFKYDISAETWLRGMPSYFNILRKLREKACICIHALPRTGGNHLLANLHYNPKLYCFSERTHGVAFHDRDVFGKFEPITFYKMLKSDVLVWKTQVVRFPEMLEELKSRRRHVSLFNFRHPYLTFLSARRAEREGNDTFHWLKEERALRKISQLSSPLAVTEPITQEEIVCAFAHQLFNMSELAKHSIGTGAVFHETLIANRGDILTMLYNKLGLKDEYCKPYSHEDFFNDEYPATVGFGGYDPMRKVSLDNELKILQDNAKEANKMLLDTCVVADKLGTMREIIDQYMSFYVNLVKVI